jgi:hypothetical protein
MLILNNRTNNYNNNKNKELNHTFNHEYINDTFNRTQQLMNAQSRRSSASAKSEGCAPIDWRTLTGEKDTGPVESDTIPIRCTVLPEAAETAPVGCNTSPTTSPNVRGHYKNLFRIYKNTK